MKKIFGLILVPAALIIAVDQVIKYLVAAYLPLGGTWSPLPGPNPLFQIAHIYNTGVAFGLFQNIGPVFIIVPLLISSVIIFYARQLRPDQKLMALALGLMLGGALGNVVDRIRLGHVIDFFDIGLGTLRNASNLADWSIVSGVGLLAIAMLREERRQKKSIPGDAETQSLSS